MKKLFYLLVLAILLIPFTAKADMGGPVFTYKVRVTNKNGAQKYDTYWDEKSEATQIKKKDGTAKFDTILEVMEEEKIEGKEYIYVYTDSEGFYLLSDDVEPYGKINLEDYKNDYPEEGVIFREGAYLYNGPSYKFGKTSDNYMIPVGTKIKSYYFDELFAYVEVNGHKGWVYIYQYDDFFSPYDTYGYFATLVDEDSKYTRDLYTVDETTLYEDFTTGKKASVKFPKNTKIKPILSYSYGAHNPAYQIEYQGEKYWIIVSDFVTKTPNKNNLSVVTFSDAKIYNSISANGEADTIKGINSTGVVIPKYSKVKYDYYSMSEYGLINAYEVTYNGTHGWIFDDGDGSAKIESEYGDYLDKLADDIDLYKDPKSKTPTKTLTAGTLVDVIAYSNYDDVTQKESYEEWCYIITTEAEGWAKYSELSIKDSRVEPKQEDPEDPEDPIDPKHKIIEENRKKRNKKIAKPDEEDNKIVLYSIIGGAVVVLAGIVTFIFVNKKKKAKKKLADETAVEDAKETETVEEVKEEVTETPVEETKEEVKKASKGRKGTKKTDE